MDDTQGLLQGLNSQQKEAVEHDDGALMVVAGPGSGKTRVLTARLARLALAGCPEDSILAVTFTNKAAGEMRARLSELLGPDRARRVWMGTFHGVCLRILRRHPAAAGLADTFSVVDADAARKLVRQCLVALDRPASPSDVREAHSAVSRAKNDGLDPASALSSGRFSHIADVFAAYQQTLEEANGVDFDDILTRALTLLSENESILRRYQERFRHVLVDEFQDTNYVQYRVVQLLGRTADSVCAVGDPDQSIYSWRGSRPDVVQDFLKDFAPVRQVLLEENYRSTPEIVAVCNALLSQGGSDFERTLTTSNQSGDKVSFKVHADDRVEVDDVVSSIARVSATESVAVICRTNAQTRPFEEALMSRGIPYAVVGSLRFYERAEVRDAIAYIKAAATDTDLVSLSRVFNTPRRGLGPAAWTMIAEEAAKWGSLTTALEALGEDASARRYASGISSLLSCLRQVRSAADNGPDAALAEVLGPVGLISHYQAQSDGPDRKGNLGELLSATRQFTSPEAGSVTLEGALVSSLPPFEATLAFLDSTALVSGSDTDSQGARVVLTTAHAAKGREFDHVWVVGVEDGLFPHVSSENVAEERRLLFVALSRARMGLTVSRARQRMMFGSKASASPSPFLAAFPEGSGRLLAPTQSRPVAPRRPLAPSYRLPASAATPGTVVTHHVFGPGTIKESDGQTVTVSFGAVVRQLRLDLAPLQLAEPDSGG